MALMAPARRQAWMARIRSRAEQVSLASDPRFQETFAECLGFPQKLSSRCQM